MRHGAPRFSFLGARAGSDDIGCDKSGASFAASVANSCRAHCFAEIDSAVYGDHTKCKCDKDSVAGEFSTISGRKACSR